MTTDLHLSDEMLYEYCRAPQLKKFHATRAHLLECDVCRSRLHNIQYTEQWLVMGAADESSPQATLSEDVIAANIAGLLSADEQATVDRELLNPANLKASLHYAAHKAAMQPAIETAEQIAEYRFRESSKQGRAISLPFARLIHRFRELMETKFPLWYGVPATGITTLVLVVLLSALPGSDNNDQAIIASFQDAPIITFSTKKTATGIGFFAASEEVTQPYSGIEIKQDKKGNTYLKWPQIEDAKEYYIRLFSVAESSLGYSIIAEEKTLVNSAQFSYLKLLPQRRYGWELTGRTEEGLFFKTSGGFALNR